MTYSDIVNRIQDVVNQHFMLADFGYGDLSDLKVRFENKSGDSAVQADYPYAFLRALPHNRTKSAVTYNFDLIVMDLAREELNEQIYNNMLAIQSQCQQYIDDIIAQLYYGYQDQPEVKWDNVTYTPFNERFQDSVAGMTANLSIVVPNKINNCVSPFDRTELLAYRRLKLPGRDIDWDGIPEPDQGDDRFFMGEFWNGTEWIITSGGNQTPYGESFPAGFKAFVAGKYLIELNAEVNWYPPAPIPVYQGQLLYGLGCKVYDIPGVNILPGATYLNQQWSLAPVSQKASILVDMAVNQEIYFNWLPPLNKPLPIGNTVGTQTNQETNYYKIYRVVE